MEKWYAKGLKFKCTECGKCCTGAPGGVWITDAEAKAIAEHLGCPFPVFLTNFTRRENGKLTLIDQVDSYDCIFLKNNKCSIYSARPEQCRTFPWWRENLSSKDAWKRVKEDCEGIDHPDGPTYTQAEIDERASD